MTAPADWDTDWDSPEDSAYDEDEGAVRRCPARWSPMLTLRCERREGHAGKHKHTLKWEERDSGHGD